MHFFSKLAPLYSRFVIGLFGRPVVDWTGLSPKKISIDPWGVIELLAARHKQLRRERRRLASCSCQSCCCSCLVAVSSIGPIAVRCSFFGVVCQAGKKQKKKHIINITFTHLPGVWLCVCVCVCFEVSLWLLCLRDATCSSELCCSCCDSVD